MTQKHFAQSLPSYRAYKLPVLLLSNEETKKDGSYNEFI